MSRVQVLVERDGEREAVVSLLESRYEVVTDDSVTAADLYLVDDHSLPAHREALREQKRENGAVFCPVVLVRRERTRIDEQALPGPGSPSPGVIDEVLVAPLDTETVVWRLDNLLTRRDTTRNLVEQNDQLRQREEELERYKTFVEQSNDIITALDDSGVVQYQSPALERVLGYEQTELVGTNAFDLLHPEDRPELWETFGELIENPETTVGSEGRFQRADGEYRWLSVRATNHLDDDVIEAILINSRDITDRKREEQKRQRTVERMTDAVFGIDTDWQFVEINEQAEQTLGIDADTVLGESIWAVFPAAVDTKFYHAYHSVMESREPVSFEERFEELELWFEVNVYPEPDGGISIYFQDITERKARENRIERLNREFETVFENVRDGLFLLGMGLNDEIICQRANDAAKQLLASESLESGDLLGDLLDPALLDRCRECIEQRRTVGMEHSLTHNGTESIFEIRLSPVVIDGTVEMLVGSARDITERKQYERRIESQRDDLQLLNQMVRHDIRNDLQVIQTHGELLAAEVPAGLESSAESVLSSAYSAISLTEEARDLAAVMLRSDNIREPTALGNTLREQIKQVRAAHEAATIEIDGTIHEVDVAADEMLGSVFDNLLQNSVVHNDSTQPRTVVSTTADDEYATVRVADNGPGISDDQKEEIFDKGAKGEHSDGTGIGLYLVKTLVDQYGGSISIEQPDAESPVDGTVFVVRLPLS